MTRRIMQWASLGLLVGCWGCGKTAGPFLANSAPPPGVSDTAPTYLKKEAEGPPRMPKASTCVALAVLQEQTAVTRHSPAERTEFYENARRAYHQALKVDPTHMGAYKGLARLYDTLEDHQNATAFYRQALQLNPADHEMWYLLGMSHGRYKEWTAALESFQKAVELDSENRRYLNDYGLCLARAERYQDAFRVLKKAGGEAQAHYNLARMLEHLGNVEPSKEHLRLALKLKPEMDLARRMLQRLENPAQDGDPVAPGLGVPSAGQGLVPVSHQVPAEMPR